MKAAFQRRAANHPGAGRLIALDGTGGRSMAVAARLLERDLKREKIRTASCGWDVSDIFFQTGRGQRGLAAPPPQTLILLYATDLAFRLRWQIRPAVEQGITVIAAPYVETAIAFGRGCGLPHTWLKGVFAFAPRASASYRVPEDTIPMNRRGTPADSFLEFCLAELRNGPAYWDTGEIGRGFYAHLAKLNASGSRAASTK
jgi:hypothetical protein